MPPCFKIENGYDAPIVGVDEAGRGPLAGPVVAAAVILDRRAFPRGIDDSKKLDHGARATLYGRLRTSAKVGVGIASVAEIDELNILWATMLAMTRAVEALGLEPGIVLVDGNRCPKWRYRSVPIVEGDAKSRSIAAASIIAKVTRDRFMGEQAALYPGYGWERNQGYPTPEHRAALKALGPTPLHRRSFGPVKQFKLALCSAA